MLPGHLCPYSCVLSDACVPHCSLFRLFPQQSPYLLITHLHHCIGIFQSSAPSTWPSSTLSRSLPGLTSSHTSALSLLSLQGEPCLVPLLSCPVSASAGVCEPDLRWGMLCLLSTRQNCLLRLTLTPSINRLTQNTCCVPGSQASVLGDGAGAQ